MRYSLLVIITVALAFVAGALAYRALDILDQQYAWQDRV